MPPPDQRVSDQLIRLVQVFFALALAQSLVLFRGALLRPFEYGNRVAVLALACVFYTTVASWIDWHVAMTRRPYDTRQPAERFRVYADIGISMLYAYLLFTVEPIVGHPEASIARHLFGYPLVFILYVVSGLLRRRTHGSSASKIAPLVKGLSVYAVLWAGYVLDRPRTPPAYLVWLNAAFLLAAGLVMYGYRSYRRYLVRRDEQANARLTIGVDVDGVLADQISGVLPLVERRHGVLLKYADIRDWRLPIKDTDIAEEIVLAQRDKPYVLDMRAHEGAARTVSFLRRFHRIVVITARQGDAGALWTAEWLGLKKIPFDEVVSSAEAKKSEHRTDVLIDDYIGNVREFLDQTNGIAVLVSQPWNRERSAVQTFIESGRLFVVADLLELRRYWPDIVRAWTERHAATV